MKKTIKRILNFNYNSDKELYDYLNPNINIKCKLNNCNNLKKFNNFTEGYNDFCSITCNNKWLSESRFGLNNPVHRMTDKTKKNMSIKISNLIKDRILSGKWTPPCTNSWCHSRYDLIFKRKNKLIRQKVRSSWEAYYQLLYPNLLYEKLRIPYFYKNKLHIYIVDFINYKDKEVIEIKPKSNSILEKNIIKEKALLDWCKLNNYKYININEDYFKTLNFDIELIKNQSDFKKLYKIKKYFKDEN